MFDGMQFVMVMYRCERGDDSGDGGGVGGDGDDSGGVNGGGVQ